MDASAIALCRDNNIPIVVFNIRGRAISPRCCAVRASSTIVKN
jgi:uridylate kinase